MVNSFGKVSPLLIGVGAIALIAIAVFAISVSPQSQTSPVQTETSSQTSQDEFVPNPAPNPSGKFEFRDGSYQMVSDPREAAIIIVNSPGAKEARPIKVTAKVDGKVVSEETINADEENCADDNTCSIPIPHSWEGIYDEEGYTIEATDATGNLLALFANLGAEPGF